MTPDRYLAELAPLSRLIVDEPAPLATKIWLISEHGTGFDGHWYPECGAVAWCPLPKLTLEQKQRLKDMRQAGVDATKPGGKRDSD